MGSDRIDQLIEAEHLRVERELAAIERDNAPTTIEYPTRFENEVTQLLRTRADWPSADFHLTECEWEFRHGTRDPERDKFTTYVEWIGEWITALPIMVWEDHYGLASFTQDLDATLAKNDNWEEEGMCIEYWEITKAKIARYLLSPELLSCAAFDPWS